ncbi:MAG: MerR family transcriptional regulator [Eubacteriales bacterium]
MFRIGDFSKLSRVSVRMLRYYDENDILKPDSVDDVTGYRYYSANQIYKINTIVLLRDYGFGVLDIGKFLSASVGIREQMLKDRKQEIEKSLAEEKSKLDKISSAIQNLYKENINMEYKVDIKSIPSMKAISLRDAIPTYSHEGMLWERLGTYVGENKIAVTEKCYATYYDTEYKDKDVDVEVLMEVKELGKGDGEFVFKETESVEKAAFILVPGEYENISKAFEYLGRWLEETGSEISGRMRQVPIKGPWNEENPENYLTEIQCPIK